MTNVEALKLLYAKIGGEADDVASVNTTLDMLNAIDALYGGDGNAAQNAEAIKSIADNYKGGSDDSAFRIVYNAVDSTYPQFPTDVDVYAERIGCYQFATGIRPESTSVVSYSTGTDWGYRLKRASLHGIVNIDNLAFYYANKLEKIYLDKTLTRIGINAFNGCSSLTDVYYAGTQAEWASVTKGTGNGYLTGAATIHYEAAGIPEEE